MKRWNAALVLVLLSCVPLFFARFSGSFLLLDTDTVALLNGIRQRHDPLSWFAGDWPLGNHFYRPVSTLFFEFDHAIWHDNGAGYGLTNVLLAIGCVLLLFWFVRELTDHLVISTATAVLFSMWHWAEVDWLSNLALLLALIALTSGVVRRRWLVGLSAALALYFVSLEIWPKAILEKGVLAWLPGRTATVMTLFALLSMAAYARYERLSAQTGPRDKTPLDPPATKGTLRKPNVRFAWIWLFVCLVGLILALGSYEQAIMLPALLLATAVTMRLGGLRVRWGWHVLFWIVLAGYLVLRHALVPADPSGYQRQAFRTGPGVWLDIASYALPAAALIPNFLTSLVGWEVILFSKFWTGLLAMASNLFAAYEARRKWVLVAGAYAMSVLAFLPMAWLKRFEHYHYWPLALRSLFVVAIAAASLEAFATAVSPPVRQAPPRPDPAPGSLPHP